MNVERVLKNFETFKVVNAEGHILGRLSSVIAKRLLKGEKIVVINAEKAIVTGKPEVVLQIYKEKYDRGSKEKGPYFPKHPEKVFKRTVRGMLPWKSRRGREAYKRLRVFIGVPEKLKSMEFEVVEEALFEKVSKTDKFVTLEEICKHLGWKV
ncbi:MAG: 50S ribosomal protein L13 [Archaeoglobaceae archaeon]|nr:50S ribosomal protein L13 [Archaeoglobaceae archaeon]MCX8151594.1 50S ribosomal protein L13 [Archaeoglobaceae archaeon]MDW8013128.1 50S ribosomal protein L13 [Archaeoglobaceae archaeon]